jgi:hypothetical protein
MHPRAVSPLSVYECVNCVTIWLGRHFYCTYKTRIPNLEICRKMQIFIIEEKVDFFVLWIVETGTAEPELHIVMRIRIHSTVKTYLFIHETGAIQCGSINCLDCVFHCCFRRAGAVPDVAAPEQCQKYVLCLRSRSRIQVVRLRNIYLFITYAEPEPHTGNAGPQHLFFISLFESAFYFVTVKRQLLFLIAHDCLLVILSFFIFYFLIFSMILICFWRFYLKAFYPVFVVHFSHWKLLVRLNSPMINFFIF